MRTTIDLPDDLHQVIASLASSHRKSLSQTAVDLMRRGLEGPRPPEGARGDAPRTSSNTGLPLVHFARVITVEDVRALDDEA